MTASIPHIKTPSPKFSPEEIAAIRAAKSEAAAIIERMNLLQDRRAVKAVLSESANNFASGELDLQSAVLSSLATAAATDEVISELRGACKTALKAIYLGSRPLIAAADIHRVEGLKNAAAALEKAERETSQNLGIAAADFEPSPRLDQLRETHRRAIENHAVDTQRPPNAADFARLVAAVG